MGKVIDITGQKFGRLTVIKFIEKRNQHYYYLCKCDCGNEKIVEKGNLRALKIKSCGCFKKEKDSFPKKHGKSYTKLYRIYKALINRCYRQKDINYKNYGGRGISVCQEWLNDFMSFYNWAVLNGYQENLSIDRINVNGNYEPNNCRWTDKITQANNTRRNHYIEYNKQVKTLSQWAKELNVSTGLIKGRLKKGWTIEQVFTTPKRITSYSV